ncbi:hypothetical protein [Caldinitratiruptor microaerophilus]|uniref:Uncharacterized protein n=1 Tax=Caldinitratiruptor microaerophilus TaxID=671077 RepID=A0AA35CM18_9FIRM|nr:hypothetical protein [Caldinitratiruptor microaerophilus]BDG59770.1 hypothetical protein caldi_08600 [Caldinitratiruptor microaerophilus]
MPPLSPPWESTGSYVDRLEALRAAVQARDHRALAWAYRALAAAGETDQALRALGTLFPPVSLREALAWTDRWLRDPFNDALRARGDVRWQAMNWLDHGLRWHLSRALTAALRSGPVPEL